LNEFQEGAEEQHVAEHHEQYAGFQANFLAKCSALKNSFQEFDNPFALDLPKLIVLDTREVIDDGMQALQAYFEKGYAKYEEFLKNSFMKDDGRKFFEPIKKCCGPIFLKKKTPSSRVSILRSLKTDVDLSSRLFIISTARNMDLDRFSEHENQECSPSLSCKGNLRSGNKSYLTEILEKLIPENSRKQPSACSGVILDGGFLVHLQKPNPSLKTFDEYVQKQIRPYVIGLCESLSARRVDFAWDIYRDDSLKAMDWSAIAGAEMYAVKAYLRKARR